MRTIMPDPAPIQILASPPKGFSRRPIPATITPRSNRRLTALSFLVALALGACGLPDTLAPETAAADEQPNPRRALTSLSGYQILYRFESGRAYRVRHNDEQVEFELLEPEVEPRPSARLDYHEIAIRPGLFFVGWTGDPKFHVTMLIDLDREQVHFSALYDGARTIFETAELLSIETLPEALEPFGDR